MNRIEKARGNIETLKDSLTLDWNDLALPLTAAQRIDIEWHPSCFIDAVRRCWIEDWRKVAIGLRASRHASDQEIS